VIVPVTREEAEAAWIRAGHAYAEWLHRVDEEEDTGNEKWQSYLDAEEHARIMELEYLASRSER
jgi:hypothetical protein